MIARAEVPESVVGCGRWSLNVNEEADDDPSAEDAEMLLALYSFTSDASHLNRLLEADFCGALVLRGSEVQRFYDLAAERYAKIH